MLSPCRFEQRVAFKSNPIGTNDIFQELDHQLQVLWINPIHVIGCGVKTAKTQSRYIVITDCDERDSDLAIGKTVVR